MVYLAKSPLTCGAGKQVGSDFGFNLAKSPLTCGAGKQVGPRPWVIFAKSPLTCGAGRQAGPDFGLFSQSPRLPVAQVSRRARSFFFAFI